MCRKYATQQNEHGQLLLWIQLEYVAYEPSFQSNTFTILTRQQMKHAKGKTTTQHTALDIEKCESEEPFVQYSAIQKLCRGICLVISKQ